MIWDNQLHGVNLLFLTLMDVRRAHFYSAARRKVFVELPVEACTDKSNVGLLLESMYGCRDARVSWEFEICQVMTELVLFKVKRPHAFTDIWKGNSVCGCMEMILSLQVASSMSSGFFKVARILARYQSRNSWSLWISRLCAKHSCAGKDCGMD